MIISLQNSPFALLMQGLRLRRASSHAADAAPKSETRKSAIVPHWIDFLNEDADQAARQ